MKRSSGARSIRFAVVLPIAVVAFATATISHGQNAAPGTPSPASAKTSAPIDVTGYWVSQIVDEFRHRVAPQKGDLTFVPLNMDATRIAKAWNPDVKENQCKAYGAVGLLQRPGRLHITWADDNTLRIDADAGTQTRLLHFTGDASTARPSLQGYSAARWEISGGGGRGRGGAVDRNGSLAVVTTSMTPGYIRKNGVPYSANARLTEYFGRLSGPGGQVYLIDTATVDDPTYLTAPFIRSYIFKKLPDASGWEPTPCWPK